jgi:hypothetical protein
MAGDVAAGREHPTEENRSKAEKTSVTSGAKALIEGRRFMQR